MSIYRVQSGLIFDDSFETLDSRWVVSPSDSCTHDDVGQQLSLDHNPSDRSTNALFSLPQEEDELLLQVHADYTPTHLGDEGGIVVWKNALEKVEFLESEDSTQAGAYSVWRAVKRQNLWTFFAERGSAWELFDSTICIDPTMAGVVLKGTPRTGYVPLAVDRVILCKGTHISMGNVGSFYKVELVDESLNVVNTQIVPDGFSGVSMELPTIPFRGKLRVYDKDLSGAYVLIDNQEEFADMYGGDLFLKGTDLKVLWKGKELSEVTPTHLGSVKNNQVEYKMTVLNDTTGSVAENISVSIAIYLQDFGWTWCDVATDNLGIPAAYEDTVIQLGTLQAGKTRDFWVRLTKPPTDPDLIIPTMRPTYFFLEIRND